MPSQQSKSLDVRTALKQGIHLLREAHVPSDTLAAELLLLHVTRRDRSWLYAHPEEILDSQILDSYFSLLHRRAAGEPTQHLTGKQEFWGLEFEVTPDVLIPRPETEHLIEVALDRLAVRELRAGRDPKLTGEGLTIVDIGTGSGCIAIALAKELPNAKIYATDISPAALAVAQRNATRLGFSHRITFLESDLLAAFSRRATYRARPLRTSIASPQLTSHSCSISSSPTLPTSVAKKPAPSPSKSATTNPPPPSTAAKKATNSTANSSPKPHFI